MKIISIIPRMSGTVLTIKKNEVTIESTTWYDNSGYDLFEVEGEVYRYLGGFRYEEKWIYWDYWNSDGGGWT